MLESPLRPKAPGKRDGGYRNSPDLLLATLDLVRPEGPGGEERPGAPSGHHLLPVEQTCGWMYTVVFVCTPRTQDLPVLTSKYLQLTKALEKTSRLHWGRPLSVDRNRLSLNSFQPKFQ